MPRRILFSSDEEEEPVRERRQRRVHFSSDEEEAEPEKKEKAARKSTSRVSKEGRRSESNDSILELLKEMRKKTSKSVMERKDEERDDRRKKEEENDRKKDEDRKRRKEEDKERERKEEDRMRKEAEEKERRKEEERERRKEDEKERRKEEEKERRKEEERERRKEEESERRKKEERKKEEEKKAKDTGNETDEDPISERPDRRDRRKSDANSDGEENQTANYIASDTDPSDYEDVNFSGISDDEEDEKEVEKEEEKEIPVETFNKYAMLFGEKEDFLYGGRMTDRRKNFIKRITEKGIKGMHAALESRPDETTMIETPEAIRVELMPHQKQGLAWMVWREQQSAPGGILADDMGLGKTLSTIALVLYNKDKREKRKEKGKDQEDKWRAVVAEEMGLVPSNATLVVAPASLIHQWAAEVKQHVRAKKLKIHVFHGPKHEREENPKRLSRYDIVITTYDTLKREMADKIFTENKEDDDSDEELGDEDDEWEEDTAAARLKRMKRKFSERDSALIQIAWDRIILDEAHNIKNKNTVVSKAMTKLSASNRWCLTGTPVHNNLWDMFSLIRFLRVDPFDEDKHWKEFIMGKSKKSADRLNMITRSLLLRRTKEQKCSVTNRPIVELKPKVFKVHELTLEGIEGEIYNSMFKAAQQRVIQMLAEAEDGPEIKEPYVAEDQANPFNFGPRTLNRATRGLLMQHILVMILRLRQACVHMHLTKHAIDMEALEDNMDAVDALQGALNNLSLEGTPADVFERDFLSTKMKRLMEIVEEVVNAGEKIVIVSQWSSLLDLVESRLFRRQFEYTSITGKVPVVERQERVDDFNRRRGGASVMLLSLTAGGVGLNLVGGNHLVMVDLHWNPALEAQACDRIYRMGQTKTVYIHRLVTIDTIEQRVLQLQEQKIKLAEQVLEGAATKKKMNQLDFQDLAFLFGISNQ